MLCPTLYIGTGLLQTKLLLMLITLQAFGLINSNNNGIHSQNTSSKGSLFIFFKSNALCYLNMMRSFSHHQQHCSSPPKPDDINSEVMLPHYEESNCHADIVAQAPHSHLT